MALKIFLAIFLFLGACAPTQTLSTKEPPAAAESAEKSPGELVLEVGNKVDLPVGLNWQAIGDVSNPTSFNFDLGTDAVTTLVSWEDPDTIQVTSSNHSNNPEFQVSAVYADKWVITNGVTGQVWLEDKENQYALIGFKGEVMVYFVFEDGIPKVAFRTEV